MTIRLGSTLVTSIRVGGTAITSVRIGSTLVWSATSLYDEFPVDGALDPTKWTEISSTATFKLGVRAGALRLEVPDQAGQWSYAVQGSRFRMNTAHATGDGYVETRVANPGSLDFKTQIGRRCKTDGTDGVYIQFDSGLARLVRRVASVETVMVQLGAFLANDIWRLTQLGNLHTVTRNGQLAGTEWNDSGATAGNSSSHRSVAAYAESDKGLLTPRRFSPSLDYVEAM